MTSPHNITSGSHRKVKRTKEMSLTKEALDCCTNSPCQHLSKCMENSLENMHTDVRLKVKTQCLKIDSKNWSLQCVNKLITYKTVIEMMIMFP